MSGNPARTTVLSLAEIRIECWNTGQLLDGKSQINSANLFSIDKRRC